MAAEPAVGRNLFETKSMLRWSLAAASILVSAGVHSTVYAASDTPQADAARKKPLQRCDQLKDKAELDCLQKARERIVEARQKRENAEKKPADAAKPTISGDAAQKK
jgi:hypothetical protein